MTQPKHERVKDCAVNGGISVCAGVGVGLLTGSVVFGIVMFVVAFLITSASDSSCFGGEP